MAVLIIHLIIIVQNLMKTQEFVRMETSE